MTLKLFSKILLQEELIMVKNLINLSCNKSLY